MYYHIFDLNKPLLISVAFELVLFLMHNTTTAFEC
jgi:hypothetical protein